jgi:NADH:ubiquinone oxidoreductase subunit 5 (subunit L)/multisubunit Na+/H+ antiporter MnhA subunit
VLLTFVPAAPALAAALIGARVVRGDAAAVRLVAVAAGIALVAGLAAGAADHLGGFIACAVAAIALIVVVYAARSLQGSSITYTGFFGLIAVATAGSLSIAVATDLRVLGVAWIVTGLATSGLLGIARQRPAALRWAWRHLAIERIGDLAWVAIIVLAWRAYGTFDLAAIGHAAAPTTATVALAFAIVIAGAIRSALVPLGSWLPNSMEAPTPVSAFMHAGLVNGAGVLFAKMAFVLVAAPAALLLAAALGAATALVGATVSLVRPESKRRLGWSTAAQMGFMVLQCGCGAFGAAVVHLVAHGGYKSTAFLGVAGSIDAQARARRVADRPAPARPFQQAIASIGAPTLGVVLAAALLQSHLIALPAAAFVIALAWAAGACAARGIVERALPAAIRLRGLVTIAAIVALYLIAVVAIEAWFGDRLPHITLAPVTGIVALVVALGGACEALGLRPRGNDALYTLALTEARAVRGAPVA